VIRITLSENDLARTRVAYSPTWEAVASSLLLLCPEKRKPGRAGWYPGWHETARAALRGVELEPLAVLVRGSAGYLPDFLLPPPDEPSPTFEAELERLRATVPQRVAAEARLAYPDETPEALLPYLERPDEALAALADTLAEYWTRAVAPSWPQMRALLEGEAITRARRLAQGGPEALLADLAPNISWEAPILSIEKKHAGDVDAGGRGLLLVPVAFGRAAAFVSVEGPWRPTVAYVPRGVGLLWSRGVEDDGDVPLEVLLGRGRAAVLLELAEPASTTALALRLGVSPSTVSEHLAVLLRAGVVARRRAGRLVLYTLTPRGDRLVELLAADEAAAEIA
jgi:DNA-binding transcriptional ArsR family regulator